jgi:hypothetical protein
MHGQSSHRLDISNDGVKRFACMFCTHISGMMSQTERMPDVLGDEPETLLLHSFLSFVY